MPLTNSTATTRIIQTGEVLGQVTPASVIWAEEAETFVGRVLSASRDQRQVEAQEELHKTKLRGTVGELDLPRDEGEAFQSFLKWYHHAFSLEDGERGETDLIRMEIDTGDAHPKKQRARRLPFALRQVVAHQCRSKALSSRPSHPGLAQWY